MLFKKQLVLNDIVIQIINKLVQSTLINVLLTNILPLITKLFQYLNTGSYYIIFIYLLVSVTILFILYKIYTYFSYIKINSKKKIKNLIKKNQKKKN